MGLKYNFLLLILVLLFVSLSKADEVKSTQDSLQDKKCCDNCDSSAGDCPQNCQQCETKEKNKSVRSRKDETEGDLQSLSRPTDEDRRLESDRDEERKEKREERQTKHEGKRVQRKDDRENRGEKDSEKHRLQETQETETFGVLGTVGDVHGAASAMVGDIIDKTGDRVNNRVDKLDSRVENRKDKVKDRLDDRRLSDETLERIRDFFDNDLDSDSDESDEDDEMISSSPVDQVPGESKTRSKKPCCRDCNGDPQCVSTCKKTGARCTGEATCIAEGTKAYSSFCDYNCNRVSEKYMPVSGCREQCVSDVTTLCIRHGCKDFGCSAAHCMRKAPLMCLG